MLATLRPDSVDFPLLLHVLGAMLLVGAIATVTLLVLASWRRIPEQSALLRRLAFGTMLVVAWPSYILMRLAAQWVLSKEPTVEDADPGWLGVGFIVADAGVLVLALLTLFAWLGWRRTAPDRPRPGAVAVLAVLAPLYLLALGVAWFAMTGKPGA